MKTIFNVLFLLTFCLVNGQEQNNQLTQNSAAFFAGNGNGSTFVFNPDREIEGTEYLFDSWENRAVIYTKTKQRFLIKNINLNIRRNSFTSQITKDSLFYFNMNDINKIVIDNKSYKAIYSQEGRRICQVVYEFEEFSILKAFNIRVISGSPNPMINRKADKLARSKFYYLLKDKKLHSFKLRRSRVLNLIEDETVREKVKSYAKKNRLSFKREKDLQKILNYYKGL